MTVAQMKEAATLGAFIEFVGSTPVSPDAGERYDRFAAAIRQIGPQSCILSSDLGQATNPRPAEGFGAFLVAMQARGFTAGDIDRMSRQNPARLLGLP
jgi:predicted metal-dependent phosphotriesterase family hydrolase